MALIAILIGACVWSFVIGGMVLFHKGRPDEGEVVQVCSIFILAPIGAVTDFISFWVRPRHPRQRLLAICGFMLNAAIWGLFLMWDSIRQLLF